MHEPSLVEPEVRREEIESQSIDSTQEPCPEFKPETPEEEDPQPLEFLHNFEEALFEDFRNTSNYSYQRQPQVPVTHLDPSEKEYLRDTIRG